MKRFYQLFVAVSLLLASAMLVSCEKETNANNSSNEPIIDVMSDGTSSFIASNLKSALIVPIISPTTTEQEMLAYMKEEEKLARDVYAALREKWGTQIFVNIANAEVTHTNAIVTLMTNLGMTNTALLPAGEFENPAFTELYNQLVADGGQSLANAYKVGALIEEKDIFDLKDDLTKTSNANIIMVFENLLSASSNHLRAFNKQLTLLGITYTPVYLDSATYTQIVTASMEGGKRYRLRNGN